MKEKLLKILIYISGIVCAYAFVAIRIEPLYNAVLEEKLIPEYWENTRYGELYYYSHIAHFREKGLPQYRKKYRFSDRAPSLEEADLLLFGDSFLDFSRMKTLPERVGESLRLKAHYVWHDYPLLHLARNNYENSKEKIVLYETVERWIPRRFGERHEEPIDPPKSIVPEPVSEFTRKVIEKLFPRDSEELYATLLRRSYATTAVYSTISTLKFDLFGYISDMTPKYYLGGDRPWLFYYEQFTDEPGSFYYDYRQDEIDRYCDNIADLSARLMKKYNLKMVFMAVPSKFTVYHTLFEGERYNDFLPRLEAGLKDRGIPFISLYEDFMSSDRVLYYGTDTHWNKAGLRIAVDRTIEKLEEMNGDGRYYEKVINPAAAVSGTAAGNTNSGTSAPISRPAGRGPKASLLRPSPVSSSTSAGPASGR